MEKLKIIIILIIPLSVHLNPIVECQFNQDESEYSCGLTKFNLTDVDFDYDITINHEEGFSDDDVEFLYQVSGTATFFPISILKVLKNLVKIQLENVFMVDMLQPIPNCDKLTYLSVKHNSLTHIKAGVLSNCTSIKEIYFAFNSIATVDEESFYGLDELTRIELDNNFIATIPDQLLMNSPKLKIFRLNGNQLTSISVDFFKFNFELYFCPIEDNPTLNGALPPYFFANKTKLWVNYVSNMGLTDFPEGFYANCTGLKKVYATNNQLTRIRSGTFDDSPLLNALMLNYNLIEYIEKDAFVKLSNLDHLELSSNRLKTINIRVFQSVPKLRYFDISRNYVDAISYEIFESLPNLNEIMISDVSCVDITQEITVIDDNFKAQLNECYGEIIGCKFKFDESNNYTCEFDDVIIDDSHTDKRIVIDDINRSFTVLHLRASEKSQMKFIPIEIFATFNEIKVVSINNVGLSEVENLEKCENCQNIEILNFDNNKLTYFLADVSKFTSLVEVSLRNNQILNVNTSLFSTGPSLKFIDLSLNNIFVIYKTQIGQNNHIEHLDFTLNRLSFTDIFEIFPSLKTLNLNNYTWTVTSSPNNLAFRDVPELKNLFISNRKIDTLQNFEFNEKIELIDASFNQISFIDFNFIHGCISLRNLNLSHNFVREITNQTFKTLANLEILNLQNNEIENIDEVAFAKNLSELYLDQNFLTILFEHSFDGLVNLKILSISKNRLKILEKNVFETLINLQYLNLDENNLFSLSSESFGGKIIPYVSANDNKIRTISFDRSQANVSIDYNPCVEFQDYTNCIEEMNVTCQYNYNDDQIYECRVDNAKVVNANYSHEFNGSHLTGYVDKDVKKITAGSDSYFKFLPSQIFTTFPQINFVVFDNVGLENLDKIHNCDELKHLSLKTNLIRSFSNDTFSSCEKIEYINLEDNWISSLADEIFMTLKKLIFLNFSKNRVKRISVDLLNNNEKLEVLDIHDNRIIEIGQKTFDTLINLKVLSIRGNPIETLHENLINPLKKLEIFELQSLNLTEEIPLKFLNNLSNLTQVMLLKNKIKVIQREFLQSLTNLEILDMRSCEIIAIEENSFEFLVKLKVLHLQINSIKNIDASLFKNTKILTELYLNNNKISSIHDESFTNLNNLEILHADHNEIKILSENLFHNVRSLRELTISENSIENLAENIFINNEQLEILNIDFNRVYSLTQKNFINLQNLKSLSLKFNSIGHIDDGVFINLINLEIVSLHSNKIQNLHKNIFQNSSKLTSIDISMNNLSSIESDIFNNLNSVEILNLADNSIQMIETQSFQTLPNLKELNLRGNKIKTLTTNMFINASTSSYRSINKIDISHNLINKISSDFFDKILLKTFDATGNVCLNKSYDYLGLGDMETQKADFEKCRAIIPECKYMKFDQFEGCSIENFQISDLQKDLAFEVKVDGISANDVKLVKFSSSNISFIPAILFESFRCLEIFTAIDIDIKRLEKIDNCENLKLLNLDKNLNIDLGERTLENCENLHTLMLNKVNFSLTNRFVFSGLSNLKELQLNDSSVENLKYFPSSLEVLKMSHNKLIIDENFFEFLTNLKEFYIDHCDQSDLHKESLINLVSLEILDISKRNIQTLPKFPSNLKILICNDNKFTALNDQVFENVRNLTEIHMENNVINFISNDVFRSLRNLKILSLQNENFKGTISNLNINSLNALENLEKLLLGNHQIRKISFVSFKSLKNLKVLSLKKNIIDEIEANAFSNLINLEELDLSENQLKMLHHDIFINLNQIQILNLKGCQLISLPSSIINLKSLKTLDISSNRLTSLLFHAIYDNLEVFDFRTNQISSINPKLFNSQRQSAVMKGNLNPCVGSNNEMTLCFEKFNNLQYCDIKLDRKFNFSCKIVEGFESSQPNVSKILVNYVYNKNQLLNVSVYEIFEAYENVSVVEFWNSSITDISGINSCRNLKTFDLRINNIESIYETTFSECVMIEILILIRNNISFIDEKSFATLKNLKLLDLSINNIEKLQNETFKENFNLDRLFLGSNKVSSVSRELFASLVNLRVLKMTNNSLSQLNQVFINLKNLQELYLDQNSLTHLDEADLNKLIKLKYLNVEKNQLTQIDLNKFSLKFLSYFDVSSNKIEKIDGNFLKFKSLRLFVAFDNVCMNEAIDVENYPDAVFPKQCNGAGNDEL